MANIETNDLIKTISKLDHTGLKQFLDCGLNVNHRINDWSLLHYACYSIDNRESGTDKHIGIIKLLLDYGADINAKDEIGWTPLHLACQLGILNMISFLIKNGADKDVCNLENLRPIDLIEPDNYIAMSFLF